jgi:hypothetical protein
MRSPPQKSRAKSSNWRIWHGFCRYALDFRTTQFGLLRQDTVSVRNSDLPINAERIATELESRGALAVENTTGGHPKDVRQGKSDLMIFNALLRFQEGPEVINLILRQANLESRIVEVD